MKRIAHETLLRLARLTTPTVYNGWEAVTRRERVSGGLYNREETRDFMPQMGPMVGYAITVVVEPSNASHSHRSEAWTAYRRYVGSIPGPKVVVVQDLDDPHIGSFWGEVNANTHRALGCVGTITHGAIRDVDEMTGAGFKALARRLCVGHAYSTPVRWDCPIEVFGCRIEPGLLLHADKHGFLGIPEEDMDAVLEASLFMDANECNTVIRAAREATGETVEHTLAEIEEAGREFARAAAQRLGADGEW